MASADKRHRLWPCPGPLFSWSELVAGWALPGLALLAAANVVAVRGVALGTIPIDGSYYVAKAMSLGETGALRVPWGNGIDAKFLPGLSILLALPLRWFGLPWGWLLVEAASLVAAALLTARLAARLGVSPRAARAAAVAFAVDPLVVKWGSVPYAELPALALTLAGVELAFRALEARRRAPLELAAAACVGAAAATRLEAMLALPFLVAISCARRRASAGAAAAALTIVIAVLPLGAHIDWLHAQGIEPGSLAYVEEFRRNFRVDRLFENGLVMFREVAHATPPTSALADVEPVARGALIALGLLGLVAAAVRARLLCAAAGLLLVYPWVHALWYFVDGRFMLFVWPVGAALVGAGFDTVISWIPEPARVVALTAGLALAATLLAVGDRTAYAHGLAWERVTGGPADRLARRIDEVVGPRAEGFYEIGGPMVAVYRRAPARFAYAIPTFFEVDVAPQEIPALLERGGGFALTTLSLREWAAARAGDPEQASRFRAVLAEQGRTVIVAAPRERLRAP
jgi:hypothetical protein